MPITQRIQAKKVLYDLVQHRQVSEKSPDTIYFDSQGEFACYRMLDTLFPSDSWNIGIHRQLIMRDKSWKLDFCISPQESSLQKWQQLTAIAEQVNDCSIGIPICQLWVEFKGYQDKNFCEKMSYIKSEHPSIAQSIILCGDDNSAFGFWHQGKRKSFTHFIISCHNLEKEIRLILNP
jgi:hypothetical protein